MLKNVKIIRSIDERLVDAGISNLSTKNLEGITLFRVVSSRGVNHGQHKDRSFYCE
jgi:hypothetical protein